MRRLARIKSEILKGSPVQVNGWTIRVASRGTDIIITDPQGYSKKTSFFNMKRALRDFARAAGIPETTPKPVTYPSTERGDAVLGPDSTLNKPWKDPAIESNWNEFDLPDTDLGADTTTNEPKFARSRRIDPRVRARRSAKFDPRRNASRRRRIVEAALERKKARERRENR